MGISDFIRKTTYKFIFTFESFNFELIFVIPELINTLMGIYKILTCTHYSTPNFFVGNI